MLAFSHIPKTAGTTLNYILQKNFGNRLINVIPRKGSNYNYSDFKKDNFIYGNAKCIAGHGVKPFIDYKEFNKELQWFTFLRDPIKRYVSQYIHQQTGVDPKYQMNIVEWSKKFKRSNWQVKWIVGEEDLEAAKQLILEKFIFVGITEKFDESLIMMKNIFDQNLDITYEKPKMVVRNRMLKKHLFGDKYNELIPLYQEENELDIKLYDFVLDNIYPKQKKFLNNQKISTVKNNIQLRINVNKYKVKRNLIYKPYIYLTK